MALARLAMRNLQQKVNGSNYSSLTNKYWRNNNELVARFASAAGGGGGDKGKSEGTEVAVSEGNKSRLFPRRRGGRKWLSRNQDRDFSPSPFELFPSGLGNALMQATENINRIFDNMNVTPWSLSGRVKEKDDHYKLKYDMPGIPKENVKITIGDGVLTIKGEHKEEKESGNDNDDNEYWSSSSYGYYNTSMVLPDDAKVDDIKAELKDGVLTLTIPRTEKPKKDVKEIDVE